MNKRRKKKKKDSFSRNNAIFLLMVSCVALLIVCGVAGRRMRAEQQSLPVAVSPVDVTPVGDGASNPPQPDTGSTTAEMNMTTTTTTTTTTAVASPDPNGLTRYECGGKLRVISESANVRTDAGAEFPLVATIHSGESYEVLAQKDSTTGIRWYEIKLPEGTGYVAGSYISYDGKLIGAKAYLTFDDGPSDNTPKVLDILDRYGAKATFFVIKTKGYDDVYRDIVERGHTLALHSYTHDYSQIYRSNNAYFDDLGKLSDFIYDLTGERSTLIRFPGGSSNTVSAKHCKGVMSYLTKEAERRGFRYYDWDVSSGDADKNVVPRDTIVQNIKNNIGNRAEVVILMHDAHVKTTTVDALPEIIEYLQAKGFSLEALTEGCHEAHQRVNN